MGDSRTAHAVEPARAAGPAGPPRPGAPVASRRRFALLALVAALCLLSGPRSSESAPPVAEAPVVLDARRVAEVVGVWNPLLSTRERQRIGAAVIRYSAKYELDPELVTAIVLVESSARPWARSPKGAQGLMQVMPHMTRPMGMAGNLATIETNVEAGCRILADNIRRLGEEDGISAYFWGSRIRGDGYLRRVQWARSRVRRLARS